jgi:hypothetical protein
MDLICLVVSLFCQDGHTILHTKLQSQGELQPLPANGSYRTGGFPYVRIDTLFTTDSGHR